MSEKAITVDVREDIRNGREPFRKIMSAVAQLRPGEQLLVIAPFEPVPLFHVMAKQGFQHRAQQAQSGDWEVLFSREPLSAADTQSESHNTKEERAVADKLHASVSNQRRPGDCTPYHAGVSSPVTELDARGLEPPEPMVKILETLANLPVYATLRARTDRRPIHLYAELEARGFSGITKEENDGSFVTHICRQ